MIHLYEIYKVPAFLLGIWFLGVSSPETSSFSCSSEIACVGVCSLDTDD